MAPLVLLLVRDQYLLDLLLLSLKIIRKLDEYNTDETTIFTAFTNISKDDKAHKFVNLLDNILPLTEPLTATSFTLTQEYIS